MIRATTLVSAVCCTLLAPSAATQTWMRTHGSVFLEHSESITVHPGGGCIVTGGLTDSSFDQEATILRLDESGNFVWRMLSTGPQTFATFNDAAVDTDGNIIAVGVLADVPWIAKFANNFAVELMQLTPTASSGGFVDVERTADGSMIACGFIGSDAYVCKFTKLGAVLWQKRYGLPSVNFGASSISQTKDGGYVISGRTSAILQNGIDAWVAKLDGNGNLLWQKAIGTSGLDGIKWTVSIDETTSGDLVMTASRDTQFPSAASDDVWVVRFSAQGAIKWQFAYDLAFDYPRDIVATSNDRCLVLGETSPDGTTEHTQSWLIEIDATGKLVHQTRFGGGNALDFANGLDVASDGSPLVAGTTVSFAAKPNDNDHWVLRFAPDLDLDCPCPFTSTTNAKTKALAQTLFNNTNAVAATVPAQNIDPNVFFAQFGTFEAATCASNAAPWSDLGFGKPGTNGVPCLAGVGSLKADQFVSAILAGARPNSLTTIVIGTSRVDAPFFGGTLVPAPDVVVRWLTTDALGMIHLPSTLPHGIPSGFRFYVQYAVVDPNAATGVALSNAIEAVTP